MKQITILITFFALLASWGAAQDPKTLPNEPQVTLSANSMDVRTVISTIFAQASKSYVLDNGITGPINLGLRDVAFEEALQIVAKLSGLKYEVQNGIFFISKNKQTPSGPPSSTEPAKPVLPVRPKGTIPAASLQKRVTTRFDKTDIRSIFADLTRQTGIEFEITNKVPAYKLDAYLIDTSIKFALDTIVKAAGLEYKLTDNLSILIDKPAPTNRVALVGGDGKN